MSPSKIASLLIAIFTIFLVIILATRESGVERMRTHLVGEIAPPVSGMTIEDDFWSLDNQKGRWVLVNFFSTTCIPCLEEHPELVSFSESQSVNNDVRIVSVAFDDDASSVASFFDENGGNRLERVYCEANLPSDKKVVFSQNLLRHSNCVFNSDQPHMRS